MEGNDMFKQLMIKRLSKSFKLSKIEESKSVLDEEAAKYIPIMPKHIGHIIKKLSTNMMIWTRV